MLSVDALEAWKRKSLPVIAHFPGCSYRKSDLDKKEKKRERERHKKNREKGQTRKRKNKDNITEKHVIAGLSPKWSVVLSPDSKVDI